MTRQFGLKRALIAMVFTGLALSPIASATQFMGGGSVYVADTVEINDDLFVGGQNTNINGHIRGDLVTAGMSATIDGEVDGAQRLSLFHDATCDEYAFERRIGRGHEEVDHEIVESLGEGAIFSDLIDVPIMVFCHE